MRRFFYVDGALGTTASSSFEVVQYPISMRLQIKLMDDPRDEIYPPQLHIT